MAEIARRAGVGMATVYRNVPGRRELHEALYTDEVNAICEAVEGDTPGPVLMAWLHRLIAFSTSKRHIASQLLTVDRGVRRRLEYWKHDREGSR